MVYMIQKWPKCKLIKQKIVAKFEFQRSDHILNSTEAREPTGFEGQRSKVPADLFLLQ